MDLKPIFNKLTVNSFNKYIEINQLDIRKPKKKEYYETVLQEEFISNKDSLHKFKEFYRNTEVAGKKHYFLYKINYTNDIIELINKWCSKHKEDKTRELNPEHDNNMIYYSKDDGRIIIKRFKIKEIYKHLNDNIKNDILSKDYSISKIHFVEFIEFDLNNNKLIFGYDTYGDLTKKDKLKEKLHDLLRDILKKHYFKIESLIDSDHIEQLRALPNCIVYSLANRATKADSAVFKKNKANIDRVMSDLQNRRYSIENIKKNNPDYDIQTHCLLSASIEKSIDNDFALQSNKADFYFFSNECGITSNFRFRIDTKDSQIITFSSSITRMELWDVFNRIN